MDSTFDASWDGPSLWQSGSEDDIICVIDTETTGLERDARIIEVAVARIRLPSCEITERYGQLVNPMMPIPARVQTIHHINDQMVRGKETIQVILPRFLNFIGKSPIAAHNARYDRRILGSEMDRIGLAHPGNEVFDTIPMAKKVLPKGSVPSYNLTGLIKHFNIHVQREHRAMDDVLALTEIMRSLLAASGGKTFRQLSGEPDEL
jgi:DNA polymerase III epsilon subunit-like protein